MDWQSLNFPGKPDDPNNPFLERAKSLAFLAANLAVAADTAFRATSFPSPGCSSNHLANKSFVIVCTNVFASVFPSFVLVWPSNCGSRSFTETIAVKPSRISSPVNFGSFSFKIFHCLAYLFTVAVSAARKPSSCIPPSGVLIVFANV